MQFVSTRNKNYCVNLSEAISQGLAIDGGLFVPEYLPSINWDSFPDNLSYPEFSEKVLQPFFAEDKLLNYLPEICKHTFSFPVPTLELQSNTFLLELFHGPTLSFKDFGALFLAECMNKLESKKKIMIMVATSGDTGSAVANAFYRKDNVNVVILYPKDKITKRQEQQITCWNDNIHSFAVNGSFDDCQHLVKTSFHDPVWNKTFNISSANSINIGRLLPQLTYYAYSSVQHYQDSGEMPGYIIPSGNLGNATAAYYAKLMGFPIREIVLATNANKVMSDYLQQGKYQPRSSIKTLANAMDVGHPSNFERLHFLFPEFSQFKNEVKAYSVSDEEIKQTIIKNYQQHKKIICPHTATSFCVGERLSDSLWSDLSWIIVGTAHASKFDDVIEPILNRDIPVPESLQKMLSKPSHVHEIESNLDEIKLKILMELNSTHIA